ncbi:MAG: ParA family protein [Synergistaceae bacterium]|nr:ParA family protein [Synergistaceae bacterium]
MQEEPEATNLNDREKLAVTVWNYKGGVGKTTISLILAEIAARKGLKVLAIDLDKQRNLSAMLELTNAPFSSIQVTHTLNDSLADEDFDFFVIDTHPAQNDDVLRALKFADIVLIPILCDYQSVINLAETFNFAYSAGLGKEQVALVKNCITGLRIIFDIEAAINRHSYPVAGRLPRCNTILRNLATGSRWDRGFHENQREPFYQLYDSVWSAYRDMRVGQFDKIWERKKG